MQTIKCTQCNGKGFINHYDHIQNGICFKCKGKGTIEINETKEVKKLQKKQLNEMKKRYSRCGFNDKGELYLIDIKNSYSIKEQLKKDGAKWSCIFNKWVFMNPNEKYNLIQVKYEDIVDEDFYLNKDKINAINKKIEN